MLNDLKQCDNIIFEVGVNIPNYYIRATHHLGWIIFLHECLLLLTKFYGIFY